MNSENGKKRILLVDDIPALRQFLAEVLRSNGYEVVEASNGLEALRATRGEAGGLDLVLTDVIMPQMGGRELVERLREKSPELRVIYISGYDMGHLGPLSHGTWFLQKPFTAPVLLAAVREAFREFK